MKWNEVTWYSRLGAVILFIGIVPALGFYIGIQYERVTSFDRSEKMIGETGYETVNPGELPIENSSIDQVRHMFPEDNVQYGIGYRVRSLVNSEPLTYDIYISGTDVPTADHVNVPIRVESADGPLLLESGRYYRAVMKYDSVSEKFFITKVLRPIYD